MVFNLEDYIQKQERNRKILDVFFASMFGFIGLMLASGFAVAILSEHGAELKYTSPIINIFAFSCVMLLLFALLMGKIGSKFHCDDGALDRVNRFKKYGIRMLYAETRDPYWIEVFLMDEQGLCTQDIEIPVFWYDSFDKNPQCAIIYILRDHTDFLAKRIEEFNEKRELARNIENENKIKKYWEKKI